jgi:hypothetical protein
VPFVGYTGQSGGEKTESSGMSVHGIAAIAWQALFDDLLERAAIFRCVFLGPDQELVGNVDWVFLWETI